MRMLMSVSFPHEPFNTAVRKGIAGETIDKILKAIKEAVYFTEQDGRRGAILIVNMESQRRFLPSLSPGSFISRPIASSALS